MSLLVVLFESRRVHKYKLKKLASRFDMAIKAFKSCSLVKSEKYIRIYVPTTEWKANE